MRILHTADWHFGKTIEGRDRGPEQEAFVEELCAICLDEAIDLVLVAGDVFQSPNPSAAAEELFYYAMDRLVDYGRRGVVVIAGNHDNPERIRASSPLADKLGITLVGLPKDMLYSSRPAAGDKVRRINGGQAWLELVVPGVEHAAVIAALPYPSEGRLKELLTDSLEDRDLRLEYNERITALLRHIGGNYRRDTVNLAMSHLFVRGGIESDSEYQIQVGGTYAVDPAVFPANVQYAALGHLHRPQYVGGSAAPIRYAGSPLAYSFSEAGYSKSVTVVNVLPGQAADIREIFLASGRSLVKWRADRGLGQVRDWVAAGRDQNAWIDLEIRLSMPLTMADIQELRGLHPGFVNIRPVMVASDSDEGARRDRIEGLPIDQLFIRFYEQATGGAKPDDKLVELFLELSQNNPEDTAVEAEVKSNGEGLL
ncbi:MAG TPA: exonuclease subunit SbcD [Methylomusa anaerophila]|uniref:Nuclease SbcCD subunit D n=1 Tax=Methylomusa anaerophila TaxID=1930071 RepID=A0A348AHJ4_9FIRM|nr:exonuclease subunit SbcD [Methylomusa anaerophila]BBB90542.1 nuclease SbcCD subunit D [Methylomusa anaerophila]HML89818.1 exonuclease subunit SbcD [Methylomusa anaerophila]